MDILVHRKTNKIINGTKKNGMQRCGRKKCAMCQFVKEMDTLKTPDGKLVTVNQEITCQTKNVIYMASCSRCDKVIYIGETGTALYQRTMNHLSSIRNNRYGAPLTKHFNERNHSIGDFRIVGLEAGTERGQCGLQKAKRGLLDQEDADRRIWGEQETLTLTLDVKLFTLLGKQ